MNGSLILPLKQLLKKICCQECQSQNCVLILIFAVADPGISNRRGGGARVLKKINYKLYKHCMLTTIKGYAYYAAKIHKSKLEKFKTLSPGSALALSTLGS